MDIIGQIFIEVIAIFGIDEKEADQKGLWKKFEKSLKEILYDQTQNQDQLIAEILIKIYNILLELSRNDTNYSEFLKSNTEKLASMVEQLGAI